MPEKIYSKPPAGKEGDDQKAAKGAAIVEPVDEESIEDTDDRDEDKDDDA
jgi:hypothetical protein